MAEITGGCACGAVRFEITADPVGGGICHCRACQYAAGGPPTYVLLAPKMAFKVTKGEPKVYTSKGDSGADVGRAFCAECGTPLQVRVDHQPETVDFPVATLDAPDAIAPEFHIFWGSKVAWFNPGDDLPKHNQFRPDTRGLDGTAPPDNSSLAGRSA